MPTLKKIIRNIDSYSVEELASFVLAGDCTVYELNKSGHLSPLTKRRIEQIVAAGGTAAPAPEAPAQTPHTPPPPPPSGAHGAAMAYSSIAEPYVDSGPKTTLVDLTARQSAAGPQQPPQHQQQQWQQAEPQTPRPDSPQTPADMPPIPDNDRMAGKVITPVSLFD